MGRVLITFANVLIIIVGALLALFSLIPLCDSPATASCLPYGKIFAIIPFLGLILSGISFTYIGKDMGKTKIFTALAFLVILLTLILESRT
jgi:apolipoprotein N-acyltransferase